MSSSIRSKRVSIDIPLGFRFRPSDSLLLSYYLKNKILNRGSHNVIPTIDVYGDSPFLLPLDEFKYGDGTMWFFFTNKFNRNLATDDGYWSPRVDEEIVDGAKVIGFKLKLIFYQSSGVKTAWRMHEYRINLGTFTAAQLNRSVKFKIENLVLCKIFRVGEDVPNTNVERLVEG